MGSLNEYATNKSLCHLSLDTCFVNLTIKENSEEQNNYQPSHMN